MMPVIRVSDATFANLKTIATWLSTETPPDTIDRMVGVMMEKLGLEHNEGIEPDTIKANSETMEFVKAPGLSFTRIISASVNRNPTRKSNWSGVLLDVIAAVKSKGVSSRELVNVLQIPASVSALSVQGYKHYPEIGISIQGQSAQDAWKEIDRLATKWKIPVEVRFQWRDNDKAQHPGRLGILRSGSE